MNHTDPCTTTEFISVISDPASDCGKIIYNKTEGQFKTWSRSSLRYVPIGFPAPSERKPIGLGDVVAFFAKPVAWVLWYVSCGYLDYRHCKKCDAEKARLNAQFPGLFSKRK